MASSDAEKLNDFIESFRSLSSELFSSDVEIKLNPDTKDWDALKAQLDDILSNLEKAGKDTSRLKSLLAKLQNKAKDLGAILDEGTVNSLSKILNLTQDLSLDPIQDKIKYTIDLIRNLQAKLFEAARIKPTRIPDIESDLERVELLRDKLKDLGIDIGEGEEVTIPKTDALDSEVVAALFQEVRELELVTGKIIKSDNVLRNAASDFFDSRGISRASREVKQLGKDSTRKFLSIRSSGEGLSDTVSSLFSLASSFIYAAAVETEKRRMRQSESPIDPQSAKGVVAKAENRLLGFGKSIQENFAKLDNSIKLVASAVSSMFVLVNLLLKGLDYTAKANREVLDLFGAQQLNYGVKSDPQSLRLRLAEINAQLNAVGDDFLLTFKDRTDGLAAYFKAGGTIKPLDISEVRNFAKSDTVRSFFTPIDLAAKYSYFVGEDFQEVMSRVGDLTSSSQMSHSQIEQIFEEARIGSEITRTPSSLALNAIIEIGKKFGGIINTYTISSSLLTRIAKKTGLNESQSARYVSSLLSQIEGMRYEDTFSLITLAGYNLDNAQSIDKFRSELEQRLDTVESSLIATAEDIRKRQGLLSQDYLRVQSQIEAIRFYKQQVRSSDIGIATLSIAKLFPQALLPVYQQAIDGQLKIIYGEQSDKVKQSALQYRTALELVSKQLNIPEEFRDLLMKANFDELGRPLKEELDLDKLVGAKPPRPEVRDKIRASAARMALSISGNKKQLEQVKASIWAFLGSSLTTAGVAIENAIDWINGILSKLGISPSSAVTHFTGAMGGLYQAAGKVTDSFASETRKFLDKIQANIRVYGPIIEASKEAGIDPALLAAIKIQETREVEVPRDLGGAKGPFQIFPNLWNISLAQALDMGESARITARRLRQNIDLIRKIAAQRRLQLSDRDIAAIAGSMHNLPGAIENTLRNIGATYTFGGRSYAFTPSIPEGVSSEVVSAELNRLFQTMSDENNQQGGGASYYENIRIRYDIATQSPAFSGQGITSAKAVNPIIQDLSQSRGDAEKPPIPAPPKVGIPKKPKPYPLRAAPSPTGRSQLPIAKVPTIELRSEAAPRELPPSPTRFEVFKKEDTGKLFYRVFDTQATGQPPESFAPNANVFHRNVIYDTLYLKSEDQLISTWEELMVRDAAD